MGIERDTRPIAGAVSFVPAAALAETRQAAEIAARLSSEYRVPGGMIVAWLAKKASGSIHWQAAISLGCGVKSVWELPSFTVHKNTKNELVEVHLSLPPGGDPLWPRSCCCFGACVGCADDAAGVDGGGVAVAAVGLRRGFT